VHADIHGDSSWGGTSNERGVVDDGNFGDLGGYFFGNCRYKASYMYIIRRYATLVGLPVIAK